MKNVIELHGREREGREAEEAARIQREEEEKRQKEEEEKRQKEEEEKRQKEGGEGQTNQRERKITLSQASLKEVIIKPGEDPTPEQAREIAEQKKDLLNKVLHNDELAHRLYDKIDKDESKLIKRSELGKIANDNKSIEGKILHRILDLPDHASNKDWTKDAIGKIYSMMDKDGVGGITFERFLEYLREKEAERKAQYD